MTPVDVLLFDLDGTLIDSKTDIVRSVQFTQTSLGLAEGTESQIASWVGDGVRPLMERALQTSDGARVEKAVAIFKQHYRAHCLDHTRLYPGVRETLDHFRTKRLGVVTNKPHRISLDILRGLGLADFFSVIVGGDSGPRKKPHPEGILLALQQIQWRPGTPAVMVGDSAVDILAGRAAGIRTCGILSNIGDQEQLRASHPDFLILKLDETVRLFS